MIGQFAFLLASLGSLVVLGAYTQAAWRGVARAPGGAKRETARESRRACHVSPVRRAASGCGGRPRRDVPVLQERQPPQDPRRLGSARHGLTGRGSLARSKRRSTPTEKKRGHPAFPGFPPGGGLDPFVGLAIFTHRGDERGGARARHGHAVSAPGRDLVPLRLEGSGEVPVAHPGSRRDQGCPGISCAPGVSKVPCAERRQQSVLVVPEGACDADVCSMHFYVALRRGDALEIAASGLPPKSFVSLESHVSGKPFTTILRDGVNRCGWLRLARGRRARAHAGGPHDGWFQLFLGISQAVPGTPAEFCARLERPGL